MLCFLALRRVVGGQESLNLLSSVCALISFPAILRPCCTLVGPADKFWLPGWTRSGTFAGGHKTSLSTTGIQEKVAEMYKGRKLCLRDRCRVVRCG